MSNPIEIIQQRMNVELEGEVMKAVMRVGVNVDKEELIKLLKRNRPMRYNETTLRGGVMVERVTECPACHKAILCEKDEYPRFCTHCGQAIELRDCGCWCGGWDEDYECCKLPDYACPRKNECCTYTDITSLVADVNVNEIAEHIRCGNLDSWVQSWQQQMAFELENVKLSEKD